MNISWRKTWPLLLTAFLLGLVFYSSFLTLRSIWTTYRIFRSGMDDPSVWADRLSGLENSLPKGFNIIGYISDGELSGVPYNLIDHDEEFVMSQYFLAPRVLEFGANRVLVVGNISSPTVTPSYVEGQFNLNLIKNFGWGIRLYERKRP
jgi:hypothetical protein